MVETLQIAVLIENSGPAGLCSEHGLSFYITLADPAARDRGGTAFLLDAGQSGDFISNAKALGLPLEDVRAAILSHGHYDHGDGFPALLRACPDLTVYARPAVLDPCTDEDGRYIGLAPALRGELAGRFDLSDGPRELAPGLWLVPDRVPHEQSVVIRTEQGLVVLNSCCHAGADVIVEDLLARFPGQPVRALIGGLHLMGPGGPSTLGRGPQEVERLARRLTRELGVRAVYTGHCTGAPAFDLLRRAAPGHVFPLHTGDILRF